MKNKRAAASILAAAAVFCLSVPAPVSACAGTGAEIDFDVLLADPGMAGYVIDFLDDEGNILDSRICAYGEKLENTIIPEPKEDGWYLYEFTGWEPQLPEIVSGCMAYTAVYQKIEKENPGSEGSGMVGLKKLKGRIQGHRGVRIRRTPKHRKPQHTHQVCHVCRAGL